MTPAISLLQKANIKFVIHEYKHDAAGNNFGKEAAERLGLDEARIFKTLLVVLHDGKDRLAVGMVPVGGHLNLKSFARTAGVKSAEMAAVKQAERTTGYLAGGISPLGQKKRLQTIIDTSALQFETIFISAGKRGLQIELAPEDLIHLCDADLAAISR